MGNDDGRQAAIGSTSASVPGDRVTDLASLLSPRTEDQFIAAFLEKQRLSIKTSDPHRAESLLPKWALDRLIASDVLPARRLQVLRDGEVVDPRRFRGEDGRLHARALEALVKEGVSFILTGIAEDVPAIARLSEAVERRLGHDVWVNAYVTHGAGGALAAHYDDHDVIALQLHGRKRWFGHGTPHPSPIEPSSDGERFGPPQWDVLLEPGDVLYVPRGEAHHAEAEGALSVHLTFGIDTRRGVDFLSSLVEAARRESTFREDLTRLGGVSAMRLLEQQLKDRLHALIDRADLNAYLTADEARRATDSACATRAR